MSFKPTKDQLVDDRGMALSQGLFLEIGYDTKFAIYTLKDDDFKYKGKTYPSLKRLYLEMEDVHEYNFSNKYLLNWKQWKKLLGNQQVKKHVDEWREELEVKIRSQAFHDIFHQSESSFQAAKWISDKGYEKRSAGRPTKKEKERQLNIDKRINDEFADDYKRLQ